MNLLKVSCEGRVILPNISYQNNELRPDVQCEHNVGQSLLLNETTHYRTGTSLPYLIMLQFMALVRERSVLSEKLNGVTQQRAWLLASCNFLSCFL